MDLNTQNAAPPDPEEHINRIAHELVNAAVGADDFLASVEVFGDRTLKELVLHAVARLRYRGHSAEECKALVDIHVLAGEHDTDGNIAAVNVID